MNSLNFLFLGPEMDFAPDPIKFFGETENISSCLSSSLIDIVKRSAAVWREFMEDSCKLAAGSFGSIIFVAIILNPAMFPQLKATFLVASTVFLCFSIRRTIEASRQEWLWLHLGNTPSPLNRKKTCNEVKQTQIDLCLNSQRFYQSLEPTREMSFYKFFFTKNPLNDYQEACQPKALSCFYTYYAKLKENFESYQKIMSEQQEELSMILKGYQKLLESRKKVIVKKALQLARNYEDEEERIVKEKIRRFISTEINNQFHGMMASFDTETLYLQETYNHLIHLTQAINKNSPDDLPNINQIPSYQPIEEKKSIRWPPITYDEHQLAGVSEEDFNSFMENMQK